MDVCNDVYLPGLARCFIIMKVWQASRLVPPRPQVKFLCRAAGKTDPLHYISLSITMTRPRGVTHFDEMTNTHIICFPAGNRSTDYTSPVLTLSKWFIHYNQCGGLLSNYYQLETSCTQVNMMLVEMERVMVTSMSCPPTCVHWTSSRASLQAGERFTCVPMRMREPVP